MKENLKLILDKTNYVRKEIKDIEENGAKYRWINKNVEKEKVLC